jgi:hypothetical protein
MKKKGVIITIWTGRFSQLPNKEMTLACQGHQKIPRDLFTSCLPLGLCNPWHTPNSSSPNRKSRYTLKAPRCKHMPCRLLAHNPSISSKRSSDSRFPPQFILVARAGTSLSNHARVRWRLTGSYPRSRVPVIPKAQRHAGTDHLPPAPLGSARRSARGL